MNLNLVFIYLGNRVPDYAIRNFIRTANLFEFNVHFFTDDESSLIHESNLPINAHVHLKSNLTYFLEEKLDHDKNFRNRFWNLTLERLLFLRYFHGEIGRNSSILHIESDMLLMKSFPFEKISGSKLKWFAHNKEADVGSLLYSPSAEETDWLFTRILGEVESDPAVTDMSALNRIRIANPNKVETFRDIFDVDENYSLQDLFDGSSLGQWLFGIDPRNTYGMEILFENGEFSRRENSESLAEILQSFNFTLDDSGRAVMTKGDRKFILHSFHIHSKREDLFQTQNEKVLGELFDFYSRKKPLILRWNWRLFLTLLIENHRAQSIKMYLRHLSAFLAKKNPLENRTRLIALISFLLGNR